jgi:hypothetical protein
MDHPKEYEKHLSDEERVKVLAQVDYFIHIISDRYDVSPQEVIDTVRWVKARKDLADKVKHTSMVSLLGIILSAMAYAVWEGLKALVVHKQ